MDTERTRYGSERAGLLCGYVFTSSHPGRAIDADEAAALVRAAAADTRAAAAADCSTLIDRIKLLQDEVFALVGEQTNRTLFTPTIVTVLALPMTIVSSFFGMNVPAYRFNTVAGSGSW